MFWNPITPCPVPMAGVFKIRGSKLYTNDLCTFRIYVCSIDKFYRKKKKKYQKFKEKIGSHYISPDLEQTLLELSLGQGPLVWTPMGSSPPLAYMLTCPSHP